MSGWLRRLLEPEPKIAYSEHLGIVHREVTIANGHRLEDLSKADSKILGLQLKLVNTEIERDAAYKACDKLKADNERLANEYSVAAMDRTSVLAANKSLEAQIARRDAKVREAWSHAHAAYCTLEDIRVPG